LRAVRCGDRLVILLPALASGGGCSFAHDMSSGAAAQELRLSIAGAGHTPDHRVNLGALTLHFFRVQALEKSGRRGCP